MVGKHPMQILRVGRVNRIDCPVLTPRFQLLTPDNFVGIGIGIHETSEGPALAITVKPVDGPPSTALIVPDVLGTFMAQMNESGQRLIATLLPPAEGSTGQ